MITAWELYRLIQKRNLLGAEIPEGEFHYEIVRLGRTNPEIIERIVFPNAGFGLRSFYLYGHSKRWRWIDRKPSDC